MKIAKTQDSRKLSSIVFTDIVGYPAMMGNDESLTLRILDFHNRVAGEIFAGFKGSIIKNMGDGILATFLAVSDAFEAAKTLQKEILEYNTSHPAQPQLLVRIGIHLGEVWMREGDIFGHDVNVAARLQQICIPGGISLSPSAYAAIGILRVDYVHGVSNVKLKNVAENYTIFQYPSIYPDQFPIQNINSAIGDENPDFVIKTIKRISPEKFSILDALIVSAGLMILMDFGIVKLRQYSAGISLNEAILQLSNIWMLIYTLASMVFFTLIFLRDAFEIKFEDVRGSDRMLSYIIQRFGFKAPVKKDHILIFRPSFYNRIFWFSQKMRITINGNFVSVSGSWFFLRKVKKALKSYQK